MSELADLDRAPHSFHYDEWDRVVIFRKLSAAQLIELNEDLSVMHSDDATLKDMVGFYASVLAKTCTDPVCTAEEWKNDATTETLTALAEEAMRISGLSMEAAKKN